MSEHEISLVPIDTWNALYLLSPAAFWSFRLPTSSNEAMMADSASSRNERSLAEPEDDDPELVGESVDVPSDFFDVALPVSGHMSFRLSSGHAEPEVAAMTSAPRRALGVGDTRPDTWKAVVAGIDSRASA